MKNQQLTHTVDRSGGGDAVFAPGSLGERLGRWETLRESMSDDAARLVVARHIQPSPVCPGCRVSLNDQERDRLYAGRSVVCRHCRKKHRLTTGTVLEGIHADIRDIVIVAVMHAYKEPVSAIQSVTGLSDDTIRRMIRTRLGVVCA